MSSTVTAPVEDRPKPRRGLPIGDRLLGWLIGLLGASIITTIATVPLAPREQSLFAVCAAIVFLVVNRFPGKAVTLFLVALSLSISLRYIYWRLTETLDFPGPIELVLGSGLVLAEIYAIVTLVLGYIQTVWPLDRKPMPLPADPDTWPTVDVYIPTYNEPMSVVRATVLAAMAMDWPRDKMKIWLLDDGRREEFRQFADACGVGYITRSNNTHAKAGNLNNALTQTEGEFIAVFDCDHIPTRAFLQLSMGWMVAQPKLALVQTPHHFYSPDPFQRNLAAGTRVPSEGNMFYGLIQDGNDYWNACFFCGSCAVLRRTALESIGGFAVETVTEDAHTMLKMHRRGWESAYLKFPLAAGLATERLALHIGQRVRWARGMIQIFRIDNPLLGPGLTWGQRVCYLQAMGHFFFALPRVVFLTAPLAYLLAGQNIIAASPLAITAYALPHIFHSVATNSRLQRNWRHSFWSEIYETVLALFLVRVTISTLISPRRGKFNVTAKGGLLENGFFDLGAVYPNLILALLVFAGVIRGVISLALFKNEPLVYQALLLNTIWAGLSLVVVLAALAVGRETRQLRSRARIAAAVPVALHLPDGRVVPAMTRDLSQGGSSLSAQRPEGLPDNSDIDIEFELGDAPLLVPARVLRWEAQFMQVRWQPTTLEEEARVVQAVFGRADAWTDWAAFPVDRPLASLWRVLVSIRGLFRPRDEQAARPAPQGSGGTPIGGGPDGAQLGRTRTAVAAGTASVLALLLLIAPQPAHSQTRAVPSVQPTRSAPSQPGLPIAPPSATAPGTLVVRPIAQPVSPFGTNSTLPPTAATGLPPTGAAPAGTNAAGTLPAQPVPLPPTTAQDATAAPQSAAPAIPGLLDVANRPGARRVVYNLRQLGAQGPLSLRGTSELQGVEFGIRSDEVVTSAQLTLTGAISQALLPQFSNVTVTLNEQYVGTINVNKDQATFTIDFPVSPVFFQDLNRLNFRFTGRTTPECNDPLSGLIWATIYDTSTLTMTLERLPPQRDLSRLPLPFFDQREKTLFSIPFVLPATPSNESLKAAGIVAAWFGNLAAFRGENYPVVPDAPTEGNAVMVVVGNDANRPAYLPPINGPTVGVIANPNDPLSSILLIAGRTGDEVVTAATALTLGSRALGSDIAVVQAPVVPQRSPYDAPNWISTTHPVKLGDLVDAADLQSYGYTGLLHAPFRTAPDFYTWRNRPFDLNLRYRAPPGPIIDVAPSRLDVGINGIYLNSFSLAQGDSQRGWFSRLLDFGTSRPTAHVEVPAYDVFGYNDLQFFFDARPIHRGDCVAIPDDLRMGIDPDSTIDLSRGYRFTEMPNLQYFVNSGFPFTRMADFSETALVLPDRPSAVELTAYLNLMGRIGSLTGYPPVRMTVVRPDGVGAMADKDLLVLGTLSRLQGVDNLLGKSAITLQANRVSLRLPDMLDSIRRVFIDRGAAERARAATMLQSGIAQGTTVMVGAQSPLAGGRSVVALLAGSPQALEASVAAMKDPDQSPLVQGDLALISPGQVTSYRVTTPYTVGSLPFWLYPSWLLQDSPYAIIVLTLIGCLLLGLAFYWAMRRRASGRLSQTPMTKRPTDRPLGR